MTVPALPPPVGDDDSPRTLVTQLGAIVGEQLAAGWCADLLAGADPSDYAGILSYLGKNCATAAFDPAWHDYWHRTWGGRGLLYVWADSAAPVVVHSLRDEHWRPAEMCLKVATKRQIGEAGPGAAALARHDLPRVRLNAVRCLGAVGDTEHVETVEALLDDPEADVRRGAARALGQLARRLDLDLVPPDLP